MKYSLALSLIVLLSIHILGSNAKSVSSLKTTTKSEIGNNKKTRSRYFSSVLSAMNSRNPPKAKDEKNQDLDRRILSNFRLACGFERRL